MKQKHNGGFSLIETVVAIAILGLITVPCTSGLLMSIRLNEKAQQMMQAQLAVSSAVETLMAEGIDSVITRDESFTEFFTSTETKPGIPYDFYTLDEDGNILSRMVDRFPEVQISVSPYENGAFYSVKVRDNNLHVAVETAIRAKGVGEP